MSRDNWWQEYQEEAEIRSLKVVQQHRKDIKRMERNQKAAIGCFGGMALLYLVAYLAALVGVILGVIWIAMQVF